MLYTVTFAKQEGAAGNAKLMHYNPHLEHYQTYIKAHSHIQNITTFFIYGHKSIRYYILVVGKINMCSAKQQVSKTPVCFC